MDEYTPRELGYVIHLILQSILGGKLKTWEEFGNYPNLLEQKSFIEEDTLNYHD